MGFRLVLTTRPAATSRRRHPGGASPGEQPTPAPSRGTDASTYAVVVTEDGVPGPPNRAPGDRGDGGHDLRPLTLPMLRIVAGGVLAWLLALLVTLAVPSLRTGERSWWPWCCIAGAALGGIGWAYLRRGRGNAADA